MKKNILYISLFIIGTCLYGCSNDDLGENIAPKEGEFIQFSAGQDVESRTQYDSDDAWQIEWTTSDEVRIFSKEAKIGETKQQHAAYTVIPGEEETITGAQINGTTLDDYKSNVKGNLSPNENGLQWSDEDKHSFYAVYPADKAKVNYDDYDFDKGIVTFTHIANQEVTATETSSGSGVWNCDLNMNNAYMVAKAEEISRNNFGEDDKIELSFKPIMTTLEITVQGPATNYGSAGITGVSVVTTFDKPIVKNGTFQYNIKEGKVVEQTNGSTDLTTYVHVNVNSANDSDGNGRVTLSSGHKLTFTVILPPAELASGNTKIIVHATRDYDTTGSNAGSGLATCTLSSDVTVSSGSKRRITLPVLPTPLTNAWMTPLDDNIYVSQLSIPGTHDAATSTLFNGNQNLGATQALTIAQQLEMGIRAFDIRIMLTGTEATIGSNTFGIGWIVEAITGSSDAEIGYLHSATGLTTIHHGVIDTKVSLDEVFKAFDEYLTKNKDEFIFVICRNESGDKYFNTSIQNYVQLGANLDDEYKKYFSSYLANSQIYQTRKKTFSKDMIVKDARGGIILFARDAYADTPDGGAFIGWSHTWPGTHERSMTGSTGTFNVLTVQDTYSPDEDNVSNLDYSVAKPYAVMQMLDYSAKFNTESTLVNNWMINHCSGYTGTNNYAANAQNTNKPVYNYLIGNAVTLSGLESKTRPETGPTGIMLLDFVGTDSNNYYGSTYQTNGTLLPQTIIDNNYKFHMKRKGE